MPLLADIHNNILCGTAAMWSSYNCAAGAKQDGYPIAATMTVHVSGSLKRTYNDFT